MFGIWVCVSEVRRVLMDEIEVFIRMFGIWVCVSEVRKALMDEIEVSIRGLGSRVREGTVSPG